MEIKTTSCSRQHLPGADLLPFEPFERLQLDEYLASLPAHYANGYEPSLVYT